MRALKIIGIALAVYVVIVVLFESSLGYFQPEPPGSLTITTTDEDGDTHDRVLTELASDGKVYVAVNHWPRAWYRRVQENPQCPGRARRRHQGGLRCRAGHRGGTRPRSRGQSAGSRDPLLHGIRAPLLRPSRSRLTG